MASAKRARKERAFEELTVAELRDLAKQVESKEATISELKDTISELKEEKKEAVKEASRGLADDSVQAERVKNSVSKQFVNQMLSEKELGEKESEELRGSGGREVVAFVANVSQGVLATLGLDKTDGEGEIKSKTADNWFGSVPSQRVSGGAFLRLLRSLSFKFVKSKGELRVTAAYKWFPKPKPKEARKSKRKLNAEGEAEGGADAEGAADGNADGEAEAGDEAGDEGSAVDEGEKKDDALDSDAEAEIEALAKFDPASPKAAGKEPTESRDVD